jgi:hypothetical protein
MGRKPKSKMDSAELLSLAFDPVRNAKFYTKGWFRSLPKEKRTRAEYDRTFMDYLLGRNRR